MSILLLVKLHLVYHLVFDWILLRVEISVYNFQCCKIGLQ